MNEDLLNGLLKETSKDEAEDLLEVASRISAVTKIERSDFVKQNFLRQISKNKKENKIPFLPYYIFAPALALSIVVLFGLTTIVNAQKSNPGDSLYSVKRLSEKVVSRVQPSFKNEVLVRRSEEIKKLTEGKNNSGLIKKTVQDYKEELKRDQKDESKVEESRRNLEEARERSSEEDKVEIESALKEIGEKAEVKGEKSIENKRQEEQRREENKNKERNEKD